MINQSNSKIVGAFVIGLALVSGSYVLSNFGQSYSSENLDQTTKSIEVPMREAIPVIDSNNDGVEDWQEEFVKTSTIFISTSTESTLPDTTTGRISVDFIQNIIRAKNYGGFGPGTEGVINSTVETIVESGKDQIYDVSDISINNIYNNDEIRNYANTHATAIFESNTKGLRDPLIVLKEVVDNNNESSLKELETIRDVYLKTRDAVLKIPVPAPVAKEHLDLINVYNAIYQDINGMTQALSDPVVALVRLKRYEEDVLALNLAMLNMATSLANYNFNFTKDEPAIIFTIFNPRE